MKLIVLLACISACEVSAESKTYNAQCPTGTTVTVNAPAIGLTSKYKDYKDLVCTACLVTDCKGTRLFKGYSKKNDGDRVKTTGNLDNLNLKNYGSDEIDVSYRCPGGDVRKVQCYTSQIMKDCLISHCDQCKESSCEVYAGTTKVSSGKVAISRGVYQVDTKVSKIGKMKQSLEEIKKFVTSDKTKGVASAIGAAVINNRDTMLKLAKVIGVPEKNMNNMEQIIRVGNSFYTKDFDGGVKALVELTGRPLSEEEEREIEKDLGDGEIDYSKLLSVMKAESDHVMSDKDLFRDDQEVFAAISDKYGLYIVISVIAAVLVIACSWCVICCCLKPKEYRPDTRKNKDFSLRTLRPRNV